jgi:hypothetical protein
MEQVLLLAITKVVLTIMETLSLVAMDVILVPVLLVKSIVLPTLANLPPVITKIKPIIKEILSLAPMDAILVLVPLE